MIRALAVLILSASTAAAFDGAYGLNCTGPWGEDTPVVIKGDTITFYESACRMTNPVGVRDMDGAVLYDLVCSGEGQTWTERAFFQTSFDGGLILVSRGFASMRPRC